MAQMQARGIAIVSHSELVEAAHAVELREEGLHDRLLHQRQPCHNDEHHKDLPHVGVHLQQVVSEILHSHYARSHLLVHDHTSCSLYDFRCMLLHA
jgi:hypothetical protein